MNPGTPSYKPLLLISFAGIVCFIFFRFLMFISEHTQGGPWSPYGTGFEYIGEHNIQIYLQYF